jgi:hypothetical protein
VEGVAECIVDALDGSALVVVLWVLIDAHHAHPVVARNRADPQPPLAGMASQLSSQRLLSVAIGDLGDAVAM